jgi:hypothetical protein
MLEKYLHIYRHDVCKPHFYRAAKKIDFPGFNRTDNRIELLV